jgi:hypothetical protein
VLYLIAINLDHFAPCAANSRCYSPGNSCNPSQEEAMLKPFGFPDGLDRVRNLMTSAGRLLILCSVGALGCRAPVAITTYKYDNNRTGWNQNEKKLTIAKVSSSSFGPLSFSPVAVDDQVDTQPLVVPKLKRINGDNIGHDDVVYVTTESNSVYAIDGNTGAVLVHTNLGAPVQVPVLNGCNNNGPNVGINGTPVIDLPSKTMYVIAFTMSNGSPAYFIHALDITNLQDRVPPTPIQASHPGPGGGSVISFTPATHRQRAALLDANGNIYAGFGSFCDPSPSSVYPDQPRGWILGWKQVQPGQTQPLTPLKAIVTDEQAETSTGFYLSSVWMSGSGLVEGDHGDVYAVTGNSNGNGTTYNSGSTSGAPPGLNFSESVIKLSPDLGRVKDWFTPANVATLDQQDWDFGSGGIMLLPGALSSNNGPIRVATAAGKFGTMYLLNANDLGHGGPGAAASPAPLATPTVGYCWCNQSYFFGTNGPTIVSSGGGNGQNAPYVPGTVHLWAIPSNSVSSSGVSLVDEGQSQDITQPTGQDAGFFTSVSGLGQDAIVWAVVRPDSNNNMYLYAFSQTISSGTLTQLFKGPAGTWPNQGGNANIVPVVANGRVYVATYQQLDIFGLN